MSKFIKIPDYPSYEASKDFVVRNIKTKKELKKINNTKGSYVLRSPEGKNTCVNIFNIVYELFYKDTIVLDKNGLGIIDYYLLYCLDDEFYFDEQWKYVVNDDRYAVSNKGRIFSLITNRIIMPQIGVKGYYQWNANVDNRQIRHSLHKDIALAFIPNPNNLPEVTHIDLDKLNNDVENLKWTKRDYKSNEMRRKAIKNSENIYARNEEIIKLDNIILDKIKTIKQYNEEIKQLNNEIDSLTKRKEELNLEIVAKQEKEISEDKFTIKKTKVRCVEDNIPFRSLQQAADFYNVSITSIAVAIRDKKKVKKINKTFIREKMKNE